MEDFEPDTLLKKRLINLNYENSARLEVQHGSRFGSKNIGVFWSTVIIDSLALYVADVRLVRSIAKLYGVY